MEAQLDFLRLLAEGRSDLLTAIMSLLTQFGEEILIVVILCTVFWCIDKRLAYRIGVSYALAATFLNGLKITCRVDRPWILDPTFNAVESAKASASGYSFPSGHSQAAATVYGVLGMTVKKWWFKIIAFALIVLVGFSRMYLGVHTPSDVGVGIAIGIGAAVLAVLFLKCDGEGFKKALPVGLLLFIPAILIICYAYYCYGSGLVDEKNALDCFKTAGMGMGIALGYVLEKTFVRFSEKTEKVWMQIVKLTVGLAVLVGLKVGGKALLGASFEAYLINNTILMVWMMAGWPFIFSRIFKAKTAQ